MKPIFLLLLTFPFLFQNSWAQQDPEFKKGFIMHVDLHNGMISKFRSGNELFIGGLQWAPQFTLAPSHLRGGLKAGIFYTGQRVQTLIGPTLSLKLKTFKAGVFGTAGNLHLSLDHLWGSKQQRLFGGGLNLDLLNKIVLGPQLHRDYHLNNWWIQFKVGYRISRLARVKEPFNN